MMKKLLKKKYYIYILILQTLLAYLTSVYIVNDNINVSVLLNFDFFLFLLIWIFLFYISLHFVLHIKDIYDFIYKKRYYICLLLLTILVLGKFNGSSYGLWNEHIEPNYKVENLSPIIGSSRAIRSDEWLVNSSYVLAQSKNGYHYFNTNMRGTSTDVFATIPAPVNNLMILTKPFLLGYLLLGNDYGMSLYWFGRLFALFMVSFELFMLLTDKKKLPSVIGSVLITFSAPVFWWYSAQLVEMIVGGGFTILMFHQFLKASNIKKKILFSILIALGFLSFAFTLYPAWLVPLGYLYLVLAGYILFKDKNYHKWKIKNFLPLIISIVIILDFLLYFLFQSGDTYKLLMGTVYPGARFITGGSGYGVLFSYPAAIYFPYYYYSNPSEFSMFYSFFPLILIFLVYYLFKERKSWRKNGLLISLSILLAIYLIFAFISFPYFLAKVTLMSMVPVERLSVVISLLCIFILVLLFGHIKLTKMSEKIILPIITIVVTFFTIYLSKNNVTDGYMNLQRCIVSFILLLIPSFALLSNKKIAKIVFTSFIIVISLVSTIYVNPLMKGFSGIYEKPLSKELQKYREKDEEALWVNIGAFTNANYLGANGLKVINSTNLYPNLKLWHRIDEDREYEDIYNRYAHIEMNLTNNETTFELVQPDMFKLDITGEDLCELDVDYLTSSYNLEKYEDDDVVTFDKKYHKDNIYIYKVNCVG